MTKKQILNFSLWLAFCFVGGLMGAWLYEYSLNRYIDNFSGSSVMSQYQQNSSTIIRDAKKVIIEQNEKVTDTVVVSESFLMGLFKKSPTGKYDLAKPEAQALVLTNDGWLITSFISSDKDWPMNYVAINKDGKIYKIDKRQDDASGLTFVHLTKAQGMVVANFMKARDLRRGQPVIISNWLGEVSQDIVTKIDLNPEVVKSSDQPFKQILLANSHEQINALVALDISGSVAGFFNKDKKLFATDYFVYKTASLLSTKKNTIPVLGVNYVNLGWQAGTLASNQGALLIKNGKLPAVIKDSPADKAGLKEGDIILSLDNVVIERSIDVADILSDYQPQDKVIVKYLRDKQEKSVEVTLAGK